MVDLLQTPGTILLAILALGVLIIVHEGGHFLIARLSGMRVDRFSIGFGPKLWSFTRGETQYQIAAIPLGGFVQIAGLNPGEEGLAADDPRAFPNRPVWQRLATIFAGPGTNYVFAVVMIVIMYLVWGVPAAGKRPEVDGLVKDSPAVAAGLREGDEIVAIAGKPVTDLGEVSTLIDAAKGAPIDIEVSRAGKPITFHGVKAALNGDKYQIGIRIGPSTILEPAPFGTRIKAALEWPIVYSRFILHTLFTGGFRQIIREGSGPVGIVQEMRKRFALGLRPALEIVAMLSVYLGLFNLLPLPGLDGGRLVFLGWEAVSRRKVNQRIEQTIHMVGVLMLLALIVVVSVKNDFGLGKLFHR
jgi:regulator of sigma E protease